MFPLNSFLYCVLVLLYLVNLIYKAGHIFFKQWICESKGVRVHHISNGRALYQEGSTSMAVHSRPLELMGGNLSTQRNFHMSACTEEACCCESNFAGDHSVVELVCRFVRLGAMKVQLKNKARGFLKQIGHFVDPATGLENLEDLPAGSLSPSQVEETKTGLEYLTDLVCQKYKIVMTFCLNGTPLLFFYQIKPAAAQSNGTTAASLLGNETNACLSLIGEDLGLKTYLYLTSIFLMLCALLYNYLNRTAVITSVSRTILHEFISLELIYIGFFPSGLFHLLEIQKTSVSWLPSGFFVAMIVFGQLHVFFHVLNIFYGYPVFLKQILIQLNTLHEQGNQPEKSANSNILLQRLLNRYTHKHSANESESTTQLQEDTPRRSVFKQQTKLARDLMDNTKNISKEFSKLTCFNVRIYEHTLLSFVLYRKKITLFFLFLVLASKILMGASATNLFLEQADLKNTSGLNNWDKEHFLPLDLPHILEGFRNRTLYQDDDYLFSLPFVGTNGLRHNVEVFFNGSAVLVHGFAIIPTPPARVLLDPSGCQIQKTGFSACRHLYNYAPTNPVAADSVGPFAAQFRWFVRGRGPTAVQGGLPVPPADPRYCVLCNVRIGATNHWLATFPQTWQLMTELQQIYKSDQPIHFVRRQIRETHFSRKLLFFSFVSGFSATSGYAAHAGVADVAKTCLDCAKLAAQTEKNAHLITTLAQGQSNLAASVNNIVSNVNSELAALTTRLDQAFNQVRITLSAANTAESRHLTQMQHLDYGVRVLRNIIEKNSLARLQLASHMLSLREALKAKHLPSLTFMDLDEIHRAVLPTIGLNLLEGDRLPNTALWRVRFVNHLNTLGLLYTAYHPTPFAQSNCTSYKILASTPSLEAVNDTNYFYNHKAQGYVHICSERTFLSRHLHPFLCPAEQCSHTVLSGLRVLPKFKFYQSQVLQELNSTVNFAQLVLPFEGAEIRGLLEESNPQSCEIFDDSKQQFLFVFCSSQANFTCGNLTLPLKAFRLQVLRSLPSCFWSVRRHGEIFEQGFFKKQADSLNFTFSAAHVNETRFEIASTSFLREVYSAENSTLTHFPELFPKFSTIFRKIKKVDVESYNQTLALAKVNEQQAHELFLNISQHLKFHTDVFGVIVKSLTSIGQVPGRILSDGLKGLGDAGLHLLGTASKVASSVIHDLLSTILAPVALAVAGVAFLLSLYVYCNLGKDSTPQKLDSETVAARSGRKKVERALKDVVIASDPLAVEAYGIAHMGSHKSKKTARTLDLNKPP